MYLIVVYSEKGGVGKSSLSHAISFASSMVEDRSFGVLMGHTDRREPVIDDTRAYELIDMRDPQEGYQILQRAIESDDEGLFVIDTGANLSEYSSLILEAADLILVPVVDDFDSVRLGKTAGDIHPEKTAYVVNRSPSKYATEYEDFKKEVLEELGDKPVIFFPQVRAIKHLIRPEPISTSARSRLRPHASRLWGEIKEIFE